jgi:hypothetical protein
MKGTSVSVESTAVRGDAVARPADSPESKGHTVSELVSERPAAPSPFGDDQTFPLPVDRLTYVPPTQA